MRSPKKQNESEPYNQPEVPESAKEATAEAFKAMTSPPKGAQIGRAPTETTSVDDERLEAKPVQTKRSKNSSSKDMLEAEKKMQVQDHAHAETLVNRQIEAGKELRETITQYLQFKMQQEMRAAGMES